MAEPPGCQVWVADLALLTDEHESLLDATEMARAHTYVRTADRARFVLGAVLLKLAVAEGMGVSPRDVTVDRTCDQCGEPHGRPRILGSGLEVSVAHSGSIVAAALTRLGPVGIDVEAEAGELDPALAARVVAPAESTEPAQLTMREFLTYWCRKESVLKATGDGLRAPMTEVLVTAPDAPPALLSYRGGLLDAAVFDLDVADPGYVAALTVLTPGSVAVRVESAGRLLRP